MILEPRVKCVKRHADGEPNDETLLQHHPSAQTDRAHHTHICDTPRNQVRMRIWKVNTVDSEGGIHETPGRACDLFGLRKLCNDDHKVKLDAQKPSLAAFATRSVASWRLRDEAMPRCRAPDEEGATTPNECGAH